jgi:hypothetical protein
MKRPVQPSGSPPWWLAKPKAPATLLVPKRKREEALGSIGEYIFLDAHNNGTAMMHSGIQGVTVELMQDGEVIASQVTGTDGGYKFDNLPAGEYVVKVSNVPNDLVYVCGLDNPQEGTVTVNLGAGVHRDDIDIGYNIADKDNDEADLSKVPTDVLLTEIRNRCTR